MNTDKHGFNNVISLGLERIEGMLDYLGRPDRELKFIHVAGTNGKGSVCAFIEAALIHSGKKAGKFTSPNLVKVNERIRADGKDIDDRSLEDVLSRGEEAARYVENKRGEAPTQFEIWCAAAMLYFKEQKCDIVVLEVGLGGEFDATNVIDAPEIAVICHIDIDHTAYLGNTLGEIAQAKCGIIKPGIRTGKVVSAIQEPEAAEVIEKTALSHSLDVEIAKKPESLGHEGIYEIISFDGIERVKLSLGGKYQIQNASVAYTALRKLGVSFEDIRAGLEEARHPARFEEIEEGVIFDGGHNPDGVRALCESLDRYFPNEELTVIYACMADKDVSGVLELLDNGKRKFIFTSVSDNPRAMKPDELRLFAARVCNIRAQAAPDLKSAIALAKTYSGKIIICGSLYLYGDLF